MKPQGPRTLRCRSKLHDRDTYRAVPIDQFPNPDRIKPGARARVCTACLSAMGKAKWAERRATPIDKRIGVSSSRLKKLTDEMWHETVKCRAGYVCAYTGARGGWKDGGITGPVLNCHHILGKRNLATRYNPHNCICITQWAHKNFAHGASHAESFIASCANHAIASMSFLPHLNRYRDLDTVRAQSRSTKKSKALFLYYLDIRQEYQELLDAGLIRNPVRGLPEDTDGKR